VYISGPAEMVRKSIEVLSVTGMRKWRIHTDLAEMPGESGLAGDTNAGHELTR
jgi:hypothetical protein